MNRKWMINKISLSSHYTRTIHPGHANRIRKQLDAQISNEGWRNINQHMSTQAFSLEDDDSKWFNVAAWMIALGLGSLTREEVVLLRPKFLSILLLFRLEEQERKLTSRVEPTSKITPTIISSLQHSVSYVLRTWRFPFCLRHMNY